MRTITVFLFAIFSQTVLADGVDRIHVFLNGNRIFMTEKREQKFDYTISAGDTLLFDAWTDWDMLENSTLTLKSQYWSTEIILNQINNNQYGAQFMYIVKEADLKIGIDIILNYNIPKFEATYFLSITNGLID
jgi:hypothetical protein